MRPEKGHEFMLRVLHQLKMEGKVFRWLVVGAGREEYEERLRLQIESLGMSGDVFMAGAVFPALPIYRVASVLSCLLKNEAFGMVLAEASASGVPVIASETGGIPDAIQKNVTGTLLPVGDMTAWTSALRDFLSRPEGFRMMVASAREDIEYRFNINRTVQTIVSLAHQTGETQQVTEELIFCPNSVHRFSGNGGFITFYREMVNTFKCRKQQTCFQPERTGAILYLFHPAAGDYLQHRIRWNKWNTRFTVIQLPVADTRVSFSRTDKNYCSGCRYYSLDYVTDSTLLLFYL